MDHFLSDVLQCNILPFLLFHETRRITRVCTLFQQVVCRSKSYHEPNEKELQQNVIDWMEECDKYRRNHMDILKVDKDTFKFDSFPHRSYLTYFIIHQSYLYDKKPSQFVSLINTRTISLQNASNSLRERKKLISFVCNILEYILVPIPNHLANCNIMDQHYNAALMTVNSIDLSNNQLSNANVSEICRAMKRRYENKGKYTFLKHLKLNNNKQINDSCMQLLFESLSLYCPFLKSVDLSSTNVSNQTCAFIYKYFIHPTNDNSLNKAVRLIHIKLLNCTKMDIGGAQLLAKPPSASNLIKLKIYHSKMISHDTKRNGIKGQRNIRDLLQKRSRRK